jgi:molybdate transport system substrate-binding protein
MRARADLSISEIRHPDAMSARVSIHAAGSLKAVIGEIATAYGAANETQVTTRFGASGLLRQRIETGQRPDLFFSADLHHPSQLYEAGLASPPRAIVGNTLCLILRAGLTLEPDILLDALLERELTIGMSTPGDDPSGDYALEFFRRCDALRPGSFDHLSEKARLLTGSADKPKAPGGRNLYAWLMAKPAADVFVTYRTNAIIAVQEEPSLGVVDLPGNLAVGATYGLVLLKGAGDAAERFAEHLSSRSAGDIFERHGFTHLGEPQP